MGSTCVHEEWWGRSKRTSKKSYQQLDNRSILLPLPTLPPALDLEPSGFQLPPSYEETVDVEKADLLPHHPSQTWTHDNCHHHVSTHSLLLPSTPEQHLGKPGFAQTFVPIRPRHCVRIVRFLRYAVFTVYRRLFTLVFVLNGIGVYILLRQRKVELDALATLASTNFMAAILVRQDLLVNLLFRAAWLVPWYVPLRMRRMVARVYCYGGIHSGAAVAGSLWWIGFTVLMSLELRRYTVPVLGLTYVVSLLLGVVLLLTVPSLRAKFHDTFEMTHRFLGWTVIALFWAQFLLLTRHTSHRHSFASLLIRNPTFWNLSVITALLIYPWLRLRRWTFTAHPLSSHALRLSFPNKIHKFSCLSISSSPLREWHPFATFPSANPTEPGASMVISDAGDWTHNLIRDTHMRDTVQRAISSPYIDAKENVDNGLKMHFYTKSHPKAGVLSLSCVFGRVLILTTGSGIGPSLSSLLDRPRGQFARLVWSVRDPLATYGPDIVELVRKADPDACIIDTTAMGRPNLLEVAWRLYVEERAEAVFVLSNEKVVKWVVGGLERRGVSAFGPIWDS
ncbi:hypothetical protein BDW02DRAFT_566961 [Decorospora gaudefroyi]|uniref:Integral membrane protein TmpA n=1 Tax=Decorospora gaudefroyi TaxID=184978 RepID=A0A6A5KQ59_9PLEO|nr:hypothetical protein BDW02DRAFT_566961 [Decorospora gaudefroyi]